MPTERSPIDRRSFLQAGLAGAATLAAPSIARGNAVAVGNDGAETSLANAIAKLELLTPADKFGTVERGKPLPYTLPPDKLRAVGLERETWRLEVATDPKSNAVIEQPLTKQAGTALDWPGLMKLAEKHAVRYLKVMTCNNIGEPLGLGLWEGVPLRDVIWLTRPVENVRRVFYYGYHNDEPDQLFQSSLAIGRVLDDPPGELPVLLCYKLNGEWLSGKRGGPVRMLVPEAYGFKSVKWLQRVVLTNDHKANDTYADGNNDIDSPLKTFARFINPPKEVKAGARIPLVGLAQVGASGLSGVQVWLHPRGVEWPADDPYFARAPWQNAQILPPPAAWRGGATGTGALPALPMQFDPATRAPRTWPLRYTLAHWSAILPAAAAGNYWLSCRAIDGNGNAQPMPRPFAKSGRNQIQRVMVTVGA